MPTPNSRDWKDSGTTQGNRHSPNLGTVAHWPTPKASAAVPDLAKLDRSATGVSLQTAVELERRRWATPADSDGTRGGVMTEEMTGQSLTQQVNMEKKTGGQLNPTWVEWLMGWPLGWTACGASEMDRFRRLCVWRGRFCALEDVETGRLA